MLDFTKYRKQDLLLTLKNNNKFKTAIATKTKWAEVVSVINSLEIKYTSEQLLYVKEKQWK